MFDSANISSAFKGALLAALVSSSLLVSTPAMASPATNTAVGNSRKGAFDDLIRGKKPGVNQVWKLQQHGIVFGDVDVYFNASAMRADCPRSGVVIVAQAPRFEVVAYNLRSNSIWKPTREKFAPADVMLKSLTLAGLPSASKFPLVASAPKIVNGLTCQTYSSPPAWTKQQIDLFKDKRFSDRFPRKAEFQGVDLRLPKDIYYILEKIDGAPNIPLLTLNYGYTCLGHTNTNIVVSNNCRIVDAPKDWLKIPTGMKTVAAFQALNMDQAVESGINDLFGDGRN
ncbi:MAG: hypothetical protein WCT03_26635 [Candidatus Obscuribacterales bacterium]|jgi:hypothetical protein